MHTHSDAATTALTTKTPASQAVTAEACATTVLEVLPAALTAMRTAMRSRISDGLSVPQFRCLNYIDRNAGSSIGDVAAFLGVTLATASAMVTRLAQAGHVATRVSSADRRRAELTSLPAGKRMLKAMRDATLAEFAQLLSRHPPSELATLQRGMQLLKTTFKPQ